MNSTFAEITYDALLVDDEPALRQALARAFRSAGFRCDLAANGRQASEMLADQSYHVVITDLSMPEVNGHRLAVELLEQSDRPVVVVVTGVTQPKIERDLRLRGVDDILFKPVDYSQLIARTRELIHERLARQVRPPTVGTNLTPSANAANESRHSKSHESGNCANMAAVQPSASGREKAPNDIDLSAANGVFAAVAQTLPPANASQSQDSRVRYLERELLAMSKRRHIFWVWPAITLAVGVALGWMLAISGR